MVYVICDSCGCVGVRIQGNQACTALTHPVYRLRQKYHCSICGGLLRIAGIKEYDRKVMHGDGVGA